MHRVLLAASGFERKSLAQVRHTTGSLGERYTSTMKLAEKGRYAPPPPLPTHAHAVSLALAQWPEVHARTHWLLGDETEIDGADFYVGERELGHIHLRGEAHIAVPAALRKELINAGRAAPFRWSEGFVSFQIATAADVEPAKALFRLAYDRLRDCG
jgi:hypothetical protein